MSRLEMNKGKMMQTMLSAMIPQSKVVKDHKRTTVSNNKENRNVHIRTEKDVTKLELQSSNDRDMQTVLTGRVWGTRASVAGDRNSLALVLVSYKNEMVMIRADEFFPQEQEENLKKNGQLKNYTVAELEMLMSARNNSEVEFVVTNIVYGYDGEIEYVTASRKKAMSRTRSSWFTMTKNKEGITGYLIHEGTKIPDARVVCSTGKGIFIEVLGVEAWVPASELVYNSAENIRTKFPSGSTIPVEIISISREKKIIRKKAADGTIREVEVDDPYGDVDFTCSHKTMTVDIKKKMFANIQPGDQLLGKAVVESVYPQKDGRLRVFVTVDNALRILCYMESLISVIPRVGQKVDVKIKGKNEEQGLVWGYIFHLYDDGRSNLYI